MLGRLDNYKLTFPLVIGQAPNSLTSIELDIKYAGRVFHQSFTPSSNLSYDFFWDGKNSEDKFVAGSINAEVTITNRGPGGTVSANGIVQIGAWNAKALGINGWVPNVVNFYDKNTRKLYLGEGSFIANTGTTYQGGFSAPNKDGSELYIFDQSGKHIKTLNGLTGDLKYKINYNENNVLISIVDQYGNKTIFQHQDQHAVKIISPYGQETNLNVDANGWLSEITNPNQETFKMTYKSKGLLGSFQKPGGQISYMSYDPLGQLVKDQAAAGNFLSLFKTPTENGWDIQTETAEGINTKYEITADDFNFTRKVTDSRDLETITIDKPQGTSEERTPEGLVSQQTTVSDPRFGSFAPYINSSSLFVDGTNLNYAEETNKDVQFLTAGDNFHIKKLTTKTILQNDPARTYSTVFDGVARQFIMTSPQGRRSIASLNSNSEISNFQKGNLRSVQTNYDEKGRVVSIVQGNRQVSFTYDSSGNVNRSVDVFGRSTSYLYDKAGRVIEKVLPNLSSIKFSYDKNGNVTSITPPQKKAHIFSLNSLELVSQYLPPSLGGTDTAIKYTYNLDKKLTKITRPDGKNIELIYDLESGVLNSINTPNGEYAHSYQEDSGQLSKIISPAGVVSAFEYNGPLLRQEETSFGNFNVQFALYYNSDFSLKSMSVNDSEIGIQYDRDSLPIKIGHESLFYDNNGLLSAITHNQIEQTLTRNEFGELIEDKIRSERKHKKEKEETYTLSLKRDSLGRIIKKSDSHGHHDKEFLDYFYDANDQLVEVFKGGHSARKYIYDGNGNRIKFVENGKTIDANYDEQDRLIRYGKNQYKYNLNGDLEEKISHEGKNLKFEYDVFGNLTKVHIGKRNLIEYMIDGKNRRVGKKLNGKLIQAFVYQSQTQIAAELDENGKIVKRFIYGSKPNIPDYFIAHGKEYRIFSDQVGTPRLIIDVKTGKIIQKYEFDEFGNLRDNDDYNEKRESKILLPFGFAGGLYDPETKLVRFGARDYDPEIGRWTSKDSFGFNGGDSNLYAYVSNDPLNYVDINGTDAILYTVLANGFIPHSVIGVSTPKGVKYFEFGAVSPIGKVLSVMGIPVTGAINPSTTMPSNIISYQYISLSPKQDQALVSNLLKNPGTYNFYNNNCFNYTKKACGGLCK